MNTLKVKKDQTHISDSEAYFVQLIVDISIDYLSGKINRESYLEQLVAIKGSIECYKNI